MALGLALAASRSGQQEEEERSEPVHTSSLAGYAPFPGRGAKTCLAVPSAASPPLLDLRLLVQLLTCAN